MKTRYVVHAIRGCGGSMFVIHDLANGRDVTAPEYWRDEAEQKAARLNREYDTAQYIAGRVDDLPVRSEE